ncbi:MAG: glycosyltransferase [Cellulosilyticaceae bacterium]
MGISACIIAKNEEKNVRLCLESIRPFCDEIIFVDTGSTDHTIDIAQQYDVELYHYTWQKDFAAARNFSLEQATEDWILVIDCDEVLADGSGELLVSLSQTLDPIDGFGVLIHNIINGVDNFVAPSPRFFKNFIHLAYTGTIHEHLIDLRTGLPPTGYFLTSQVAFYHTGYECDPVLEVAKSKRNLELLLAIPSAERNAMYYLHLGAEYIRLKDFATGCDTFLMGFHLATWEEPFFTTLAFKTIDALFKIGDYPRCLHYIEAILERFPDFKNLYFFKGLCHIECFQYPLALESLTTFQTLEPKPFKYPHSPLETTTNIEEILSQLRAKVYS